MKPEEFIHTMNTKIKEIAEKLCISFDKFSGTNTETHKETTVDFFNEIYKNGYTVEKESTMLYCEHDKIALADRFVYGTCPYCGYEKAYGDQCDQCGKTYELDDLKSPKCSFCGKDAVNKTYLCCIRQNSTRTSKMGGKQKRCMATTCLQHDKQMV